MKTVPTTEQINTAIEALSVSNIDDKLVEALASSKSFMAFTTELSLKLTEDSDAGKLVPQQVYAALMQAFVRIGIHIGVAMSAPPDTEKEG